MSAKLTGARLLAIAAISLFNPAIAAAADEDFNPRRHFYFHIGDAKSLVEVKEDYRFCANQARPAVSFNDKISNNSGLMGGFMASKDRRDMRAAIMRRCMAFKGYTRFSMGQEAWRKVVGEGDMAILKDGSLNEAAHASFAEMAIKPQKQGEKLPA